MKEELHVKTWDIYNDNANDGHHENNISPHLVGGDIISKDGKASIVSLLILNFEGQRWRSE